MKALLDTNILLRMMNRAHPKHAAIGAVLKELASRSVELFIAPQVIFESYVVATRPLNVRGFGFGPNDACQLVRNAMQKLPLLPDPSDLTNRWLQICEDHSISGKPAHDARLVAWMDAYGITRLVTLNPADFRRYSHITLIVPGDPA